LTTYTDDTGVLTAVTPNKMYPFRLEPYRPAEIHSALTRSYNVKTFTWPASYAFGAVLGTLQFPIDLAVFPFIQDKLSYYRYMRAGVRVKLVINSTKFQYGALLVSHCPFKDISDDSRFSNIYTMANCNPVVMSVQTGATVEFDIKWNGATEMYPISAGTSQIGEVMIRVLHPLASTSGDAPADVTVQAFASFINPEVSGFDPDSIVSTAGLEMARRLLKQYKVEATSNAQSAPEPKKKGRSNNAEAKEKSELGILSGISEGVRTIAPIVGMADPEFAPIAMIAGQVAGALTPIFKSLGMNKPSTLRAQQWTMDNYTADMFYGKGLDAAPKLALNPEAEVAVTPGLAGDSTPQPDVLDLCRKPSLRAVYTMTNAANPINVPIVIPLHPAECPALLSDCLAPTNVAYWSSMFKYWRGSLKLMFLFNCSSFMTCRVRIVHNLAQSTVAVPTNLLGDAVSKVVDITGDTTVEMTIPFIYPSLMVETQQMGTNLPQGVQQMGYLQMSLVTPIMSNEPTNDPPLYVSMWVAAGEDFQLAEFTGPHDFQYVLTYPPSVLSQHEAKKAQKLLRTKSASSTVTQCDIGSAFKKTFPGLIPMKFSLVSGVASAEDETNLVTIGHRYYKRLPQIPVNAVRTVNPHVQEGTNDTLVWLVSPFQFWRGAIRLAMLPPTFTYWTRSDNLSFHPQAGGMVCSSATAPVHRGELPYFARDRCFETTFSMGVNEYPAIEYEGAVEQQTYYAMGDDFSVGCYIGPHIVKPSPAFYKRPQKDYGIDMVDLLVAKYRREKSKA